MGGKTIICVDYDLNQHIYTSSIFAALPLIMVPKLWTLSLSVKMVKSPETFQLMKWPRLNSFVHYPVEEARLSQEPPALKIITIIKMQEMNLLQMV